MTLVNKNSSAHNMISFPSRKIMIDLTRFSEAPVGLPPSTSGSLIKVVILVNYAQHKINALDTAV